MTKYDVENLLVDVKALMTANLNTKIAAIEAEKIAQGLPATGLAAISAYFEQSWSDAILNSFPAIFFGIEDVSAEGAGPATAETYTIFCEIILVDTGQDSLTKNRIHRYSRALKEVFEDGYDRFSTLGIKTKVKTVRPISFKLNVNSSEEVKVGGVSVTVSLA